MKELREDWKKMKRLRMQHNMRQWRKLDYEVECKLGTWYFENKAGDTTYEGHMFPKLDYWLEKEIHERTWMNVHDARKLCQNGWMKEALEVLVSRLTSPFPGIKLSQVVEQLFFHGDVELKYSLHRYQILLKKHNLH